MWFFFLLLFPKANQGVIKHLFQLCSSFFQWFDHGPIADSNFKLKAHKNHPKHTLGCFCRCVMEWDSQGTVTVVLR